MIDCIIFTCVLLLCMTTPLMLERYREYMERKTLDKDIPRATDARRHQHSWYSTESNLLESLDSLVSGLKLWQFLAFEATEDTRRNVFHAMYTIGYSSLTDEIAKVNAVTASLELNLKVIMHEDRPVQLKCSNGQYFVLRQVSRSELVEGGIYMYIPKYGKGRYTFTVALGDNHESRPMFVRLEGEYCYIMESFYYDRIWNWNAFHEDFWDNYNACDDLYALILPKL